MMGLHLQLYAAVKNATQSQVHSAFLFASDKRVNGHVGLVISLEPYTCGACGIQFQFYNNLLEHMQSHAGESTTTNAC